MQPPDLLQKLQAIIQVAIHAAHTNVRLGLPFMIVANHVEGHVAGAPYTCIVNVRPAGKGKFGVEVIIPIDSTPRNLLAKPEFNNILIELVVDLRGHGLGQDRLRPTQFYVNQI